MESTTLLALVADPWYLLPKLSSFLPSKTWHT